MGQDRRDFEARLAKVKLRVVRVGGDGRLYWLQVREFQDAEMSRV